MHSSSGVKKVTVDRERSGQRLDNFLATQLKGVPRSAVYRLIRTGQVRVNGGRAKAATRLQEGDEVRLPPARTRETDTPQVSAEVQRAVLDSVLFESDDVLIVNKPAGMAVHAGSGLPWGLIDALRQARPADWFELVHRLDRETSGCLALARNGRALGQLSTQFRDGNVRKKYLCLLDGRLPEALVEVDAPLARSDDGSRRQMDVAEDGKPSLTRFRALEYFSDCTYAEVELLTGRTHQIRAHARAIGLPLAGDARYGDRASLKKWRGRGLRRVFLHAHRLALTLPSGEAMEFDAPLPADLRAVLDTLEAGH
ncbi:MAG: RluA family pseudouridine synthase [Lysobacterales bacterium]|jgi:23S rRNA pseudouridine955/2504/2580 synthase